MFPRPGAASEKHVYYEGDVYLYNWKSRWNPDLSNDENLNGVKWMRSNVRLVDTIPTAISSALIGHRINGF